MTSRKKKQYTEVRNTEKTKQEKTIKTRILRVNSLSLIFCHSSSNSVSIPSQALLLNSVFKILISISCRPWSEVCMMLAFLPHPFAFFHIPGYLLRTLDNSNFFISPGGSSYLESTVYCHCFVPLYKILRLSTSNTPRELIIYASSLCFLLQRTFSHLFLVPAKVLKRVHM